MLPGRVWFRCENWDSHRLSLPQLHKHLYHFALKPAKNETAYLVDMAKVEALDTMGENRKAVEILDRHV